MNTTEPEITTETPESKPVKKWSNGYCTLHGSQDRRNL